MEFQSESESVSFRWDFVKRRSIYGRSHPAFADFKAALEQTLNQQRGNSIIVSSGIANPSFRLTAKWKMPVVPSVSRHGGAEFSCAEVTASPPSA